MTQPSGSQWAVQRRCMAIIRRVQRGGATWEDLAEAVSEQEGDEAYNQLEDDPLREAIQRDVKRIRDNLNITISYNRAEGVYEYQPDNSKVALLDLSDEALRTMVWLEQQVFPPNTPMHEEVRYLMQQLRLFLGEVRLKEVVQQQITLDLAERDATSLNTELLERLYRAIDRRQQVEIEYDSVECEAGYLERHRLNVYDVPFFQDGHYYVCGWSHYYVYQGGRFPVRDYRYFRLERIHDMEVLSLKFDPEPKKQTEYTVTYQISADLARHGIIPHRWIKIKKIEINRDGNAIVHATTVSVFWAKQTLLRYGHKCMVLGGAELLTEMTKDVTGMAENYLNYHGEDANHKQSK